MKTFWMRLADFPAGVPAWWWEVAAAGGLPRQHPVSGPGAKHRCRLCESLQHMLIILVLFRDLG